MGTIIFIVMPLGAVVVGILAFVYGFRLRKAATGTTDWPWVRGRIVSSKVRERIDRDAESNVSVTYEARISYEYRVDGNEYRGHRINVDDITGTQSRLRAEGIVAEFYAGRRVRVYYDPLDPRESVLERGVGGGSWLWMGAGGFMALVGALFLIVNAI